MVDITPSQIHKNFRLRSFEIVLVDIPDKIAELMATMNQLARTLRKIDADWVNKLGFELYNMRVVILMSLEEYNFLYLQSRIPENIQSYVSQYTELTLVWKAFQQCIETCALDSPENNKRSEAIRIIERHQTSKTAILQLPSIDRTIRNVGLYHAPYIWKMSQLPQIAPNNLIIPGSIWKWREGLLNIALLGGFTRSIYQLRYKSTILEESLQKRSSILRLPVLNQRANSRKECNDISENTTPSHLSTVDPISSLFESTQLAVWTQFSTTIGSNSEDSLEDVRLCLLRGNMVVPLRIKVDVVTIGHKGSFIHKEVDELEPDDQIILQGKEYNEYRNSLTDKRLLDDGHSELRERTEEWKEMLKEAIIKIDGAEEFCSRCRKHDLKIVPSQYVLNYTTDQVMLPRNLERFTKLMKTCFLVHNMDLDEASIDLQIINYWKSTAQLKSARRELDKYLSALCESLVKDHFKKGFDDEYQSVKLDNHILWDIWTVEEVGTEIRSIPYYHVEIPRKLEYFE